MILKDWWWNLVPISWQQGNRLKGNSEIFFRHDWCGNLFCLIMCKELCLFLPTPTCPSDGIGRVEGKGNEFVNWKKWIKNKNGIEIQKGRIGTTMLCWYILKQAMHDSFMVSYTVLFLLCFVCLLIPVKLKTSKKILFLKRWNGMPLEATGVFNMGECSNSSSMTTHQSSYVLDNGCTKWHQRSLPTLEFCEIKCEYIVVFHLFSCICFLMIPWTIAYQDLLPSATHIHCFCDIIHLILCDPLLLLPSIFSNIRVFSLCGQSI